MATSACDLIFYFFSASFNLNFPWHPADAVLKFHSVTAAAVSMIVLEKLRVFLRAFSSASLKYLLNSYIAKCPEN